MVVAVHFENHDSQIGVSAATWDRVAEGLNMSRQEAAAYAMAALAANKLPDYLEGDVESPPACVPVVEVKSAVKSALSALFKEVRDDGKSHVLA